MSWFVRSPSIQLPSQSLLNTAHPLCPIVTWFKTFLDLLFQEPVERMIPARQLSPHYYPSLLVSFLNLHPTSALSPFNASSKPPSTPPSFSSPYKENNSVFRPLVSFLPSLPSHYEYPPSICPDPYRLQHIQVGHNIFAYLLDCLLRSKLWEWFRPDLRLIRTSKLLFLSFIKCLEELCIGQGTIVCLDADSVGEEEDKMLRISCFTYRCVMFHIPSG